MEVRPTRAIYGTGLGRILGGLTATRFAAPRAQRTDPSDGDAAVQRAAKLRLADQADTSGPGPKSMISSEQLGSVLMALEAEAYALRRADALADTAGGVLTEAGELLRQADALDAELAGGDAADDEVAASILGGRDQARRSAARLLSSARHDDQSLFDGSVRLRVGGATLNLPDLDSFGPDELRGFDFERIRVVIDDFRRETVGRRLKVVETTLKNATQAAAMARHADTVALLAEQAHEKLLSRIVLRSIDEPGPVGRHLDVTG